MKISTLVEQRQNIFEDLGVGRDPYFEYWNREIHPVLLEVALNPDQIQQLFAQAEKSVSAAGGNRTMLGKGADAVSAGTEKLRDLWYNKLGSALQNSAPVKMFDEKFEDLKTKIAAKNPKLAAALNKYKQFAEANPKLQKFLFSVAATLATTVGISAAGGIAAGAGAVALGAGAATAIVNIVDKLLQGEKLSTAVGRGASAGIVAGATAWLGAKAAELLGGLIQGAVKQLGPSLHRYEFINGVNGYSLSAYGKPEDVAKFADLIDQIKDYSAAGNKFAATEAAQKLVDLQKMMASPEYLQQIDAIKQNMKLAGEIGRAALQTNKVLGTLLTAFVSAKAGKAAADAGKKESVYRQTRPLSEGQVYLLFNKIEKFEIITEAEVEEPAQAKKGFLGRVKDNLLNKITADKLNKAWQRAGAPTDSNELAQFLEKQGVSADIVTQVYAQMKLPKPGSADNNESPGEPMTVDQVAQLVTKLPTDRKMRLINYMTKQLKVA